jgi:hypothetical protein
MFRFLFATPVLASAWVRLRFARSPSRVDAHHGDHCLQADAGLIPPWKPDIFLLADHPDRMICMVVSR